MTPRTPSWETVRAKLRVIDESLDDLRPRASLTGDDLRANSTERAVVERLVSRIVDLAVDINSHVVVSWLERAPDDYATSFDLAAQAGLIPDDLARELRPSTGLRNAIVHVYLDLDLDRLASAVTLALEQYGRYVTEVSEKMRTVRDDEHSDR